MRERFTTEMKEAMKAGDKRKLGTIRLIQAALKDKDIEAARRGQGPGHGGGNPRPAPEDDQAAPGIDRDVRAGRPRRSSRSRRGKRRRSSRSFLPQQMDEAEVRAAIEAAIAETGAASMKDMGKVVGALRARYAGRMDFGKASGLVKDMLPKG